MPILNVDESKAVIVLKALDESRLRRHRQPALRRAEHDDAVGERSVANSPPRQIPVTSALVMDRGAVEAAVSPERAVEGGARGGPRRACTRRMAILLNELAGGGLSR